MSELPILYRIIISAIPVLFAITLHEVGHGWAAYKLGDSTAKDCGRLTINPIKHIHPVGTILLPLVTFFLGNFLFGFAKPVPVNWNNLKNKKRDMALVAIAGPAANLLMLFFWWIVAKLFLSSANQGEFFSYLIVMMGFIGMFINSLLLIFNLFPLPPLDGSRIVFSLLPNKLAHSYAKIERYGMLILLALIIILVNTGKFNEIIFMLQNFLYSLLI